MSLLRTAVSSSARAATRSRNLGASGAQIGTMALAGGFSANAFSSKDERGAGTFLKGAFAGALGTSAISHAMSKRIFTRPGLAVYKGTMGKQFTGRSTLRSFAKGSVSVGRMLQSRNSRAAMFAGGGLLAGGMFGSSNSRSRGFNGRRGNRFGG